MLRATDVPIIHGLAEPTAIAFAPDGTLYIGEKSGIVLRLESFADSSPEVVADLRTEVFDFGELGLLDVALAPGFPNPSDLYVAYTRDAPLEEPAPVWNDDCPGAFAPDAPGCAISGRVSRLRVSDTGLASEQVLIDDWCGQFESHSMGSILFDAGGSLYVSGGEGASSHATDYGQLGAPANPCGDPTGAGQVTVPPSAEGGALRSQDVLSTSDPTGLAGTIVRVDLHTGLGLADNPMAALSDVNAQRIVAHGLRNPFRMAFDPLSDELWIGDVGWETWDELNHMTVGTAMVNFGWPCYEGDGSSADPPTYHEVVRSLDPDAFWPLDDDVGQYGAAVELDVPALVGEGRSARFTGAADSVLTLDAPLNRGSFSIAVWVAPDASDGRASLVAAADWRISVGMDLELEVDTGGHTQLATVPRGLSGGNPHLIVVTFGSTHQRVYVDGRLGVEAVGAGPLPEVEQLTVGRDLVGNVDDLVFVSRELGPDEVSGLWAAGSGERVTPGRQPVYGALGLSLCERLYAAPVGTVTAPALAYATGEEVAKDDECSTGASALSGIAFNTGDAYPAPYRDGMFFSDFVRSCIWFLARGAGGDLSTDPELFLRDAAGPVDLAISPKGTLVYVDLEGGTVREIEWK